MLDRRSIVSIFCLHLTVVAYMTMFLHEWALLQRPTSHTCMLSNFLNPTLIVCMHDHSLMFTLSITMHSDFSSFQSPVGRSKLPWPEPCLSWLPLRNFGSEGSTSPPEIAEVWPSTDLQACIKQFLEAMSCWPQKLCNAVCWLHVIAD